MPAKIIGLGQASLLIVSVADFASLVILREHNMAGVVAGKLNPVVGVLHFREEAVLVTQLECVPVAVYDLCQPECATDQPEVLHKSRSERSPECVGSHRDEAQVVGRIILLQPEAIVAIADKNNN